MSFPEFARRRPILSFYLMTFAISWGGALAVVSPWLLRGIALSQFVGLLMFPVMILGPPIAGVIHTHVVDGPRGWSDLKTRMTRWRVGVAWFCIAAFLIPGLMLLLLLALRGVVSSVYAPDLFVAGFFFGVPPGLLEEIGWTGYAFPKLTSKWGAIRSALLMGPIWGLWHAPVVDFLGAAYPHGVYWLPYFLAFVAACSAVRVIIVWVYVNTQSLLPAQVAHLSFTGGLVLLSPTPILPAQEAAWNALFAGVLWAVAVVILLLARRQPGWGLPGSRSLPRISGGSQSS